MVKYSHVTFLTALIITKKKQIASIHLQLSDNLLVFSNRCVDPLSRIRLIAKALDVEPYELLKF